MPEQIKPKVKALYRKAFNVSQDNIDKAQDAYDNALKQPDKQDASKFLEIVVDLALAKAKVITLQAAYTAEGGGKFPAWK